LTMLMEGNSVTTQRDFEMLGIKPVAMTVDQLAYLRLRER
jgi:hypothetical protein